MKEIKKWLKNEFNLFIYNLKQIWDKRKKRMIGYRLNPSTYSFLLLAVVFEYFSLLFYANKVNSFFLFSLKSKLVLEFLINAVVLFQTSYLWGRRIQDVGISSRYCFVSFVIVIFFMIQELYLAILRNGYDLNSTSLYNFGYIIFVLIISIIMCFLPSQKKENKFGKYNDCGIILYDSQIDSESSIKLEYSGSILSIIKESLKDALCNSFNFAGRMNSGNYKISIIYLTLIFVWNIKTGMLLLEVLFFKILLIIFNAWVGITILSATIRRLHDSYNSAIWILFIPVFPFTYYVLYMLLIRKSWEINNI